MANEMLKRFQTRSEDRVRREIHVAAERHDAELHEKVRVADVINIDQLDHRGLGSYALMSHFDFVLIGEDERALFALEFDGAGHDRVDDEKKDEICRQAYLPLIRVSLLSEVRETNPISLVRYLVELVFHAHIFRGWQKTGEIAPDEPFVLSGFLREDAKHIFNSEFDFVVNANTKITRALRRTGLTDEPFPHMSIGKLGLAMPEGDIINFVVAGSTRGPLAGRGRFRFRLPSVGFLSEMPFIQSEIAQFGFGLACDALLESIHLIADSHGHIVTTMDNIISEIATLAREGAEIVSFAGGGDPTCPVDLHTVFRSAQFPGRTVR